MTDSLLSAESAGVSTAPLLYVLGVVAAILGIGLSIALHEVGHLVPAKFFRIRVTQYMIGFGPTLWSRQSGETEYGVKAIPLGGYIRMIGMYPPPAGAPEGAVGSGTTGRFQALIEDARSVAWEEVRPGDEDRVFFRLSVPKKVLIMLGGPVMNLVIAVVLFTVLLVGIGVPTPATTIAEVSECVPATMTSLEAAREALTAPSTVEEPECTTGSVKAPANQAGLQPGDQVTAVDGIPVSVWSDLTKITRNKPGTQVVLQVVSDGQQREVPVTPALVYRPVLDTEGMQTTEISQSGYLGILPSTQYVGQPIATVPKVMWGITKRSVSALVSLPIRVLELARDTLSGRGRDPESPVSVVGVGRISGEVAAAEQPVMAKVVTLVSLLAGLNLFLFLFNLVPLLPLDGGHVAGALWEGIRRKSAALRGRPDPGPVDVSRALPLAYVVGFALIALSSVVILADLVNPISING